jgi:hypothetical protein
MNKRLKVACVLLYVFAVGMLIFGCVYLFSPKIMPYHEKFLGMIHEQLDPRVSFLLLTLMKVIGGLELSLGIGLVMLVKAKFSKGDNSIWWTILVMSAVGLTPSLYVTLSIGLYTPWWGVAIMMILAAVALIVSKPTMKGATS